MNIAVVGTGYVGLVTGACLAEVGLNVTCVDIDEEKIESLKKCKLPIYEPGLEEIVLRNIKKSRLHFTTDLTIAVRKSTVIFIAVGTPPNQDGSANANEVIAVASEIGRSLNDYSVIVVKSTVPIGTTQKVKNVVQESLTKSQKHIEFDIASNPEFLKEGNAVNDFMYPNRIVIGTENEKAKQILSSVYKSFLLNRYRIFFMDIASSEMTKYAANAMLATRISFINEIANLCEKVGANVNMVRRGIGSDDRIGNKFLYPGIGYGGMCFPKDVKALISIGNDHDQEMKLLNAVEKINEQQKYILFDKIMRHFNNNIKDKVFAVWGLSFKPNTNDMREAPSIRIVNKVTKHGGKIHAYDPIAMKESAKYFTQNKSVVLCASAMDALKDADALLLITEWTEFRGVDFDKVRSQLKSPIVFDGRNLYDKNELIAKGFIHYGIGH